VVAAKRRTLATARREHDPPVGQIAGVHVVRPVAVQERVAFNGARRVQSVALHAIGFVVGLECKLPRLAAVEVRLPDPKTLRFRRAIAEHHALGVEGKVKTVEHAAGELRNHVADRPVVDRQRGQAAAVFADPVVVVVVEVLRIVGETPDEDELLTLEMGVRGHKHLASGRVELRRELEGLRIARIEPVGRLLDKPLPEIVEAPPKGIARVLVRKRLGQRRYGSGQPAQIPDCRVQFGRGHAKVEPLPIRGRNVCLVERLQLLTERSAELIVLVEDAREQLPLEPRVSLGQPTVRPEPVEADHFQQPVFRARKIRFQTPPKKRHGIRRDGEVCLPRPGRRLLDSHHELILTGRNRQTAHNLVDPAPVQPNARPVTAVGDGRIGREHRLAVELERKPIAAAAADQQQDRLLGADRATQDDRLAGEVKRAGVGPVGLLHPPGFAVFPLRAEIDLLLRHKLIRHGHGRQPP